MSPLQIGLVIAGSVLFILIVMAIMIYNRLVQLSVGYTNGFAQIDVQLRRRHDLIPNLVEIAKGYMAHESKTLEAVIAARNVASAGLKAAAANPGDPAALSALQGSEGQLTGALGRLFAVAEAYPDLKANQNMLQLTEELTTTENRISFARQAFNDAVMTFNAYRRSFPPIFFAWIFGYSRDAAVLDLGGKAMLDQAPVVKF